MPATSDYRGHYLLLLGLVLGLVLGAVFLVVVGRASQGWADSLWSAVFRRTTTVDLSQPAVVNRITASDGDKLHSARQMGLSPEPAAALAGARQPLTTSWRTPWTPH